MCYLHAEWCVLRTERGVVLLWRKWLSVSQEAPGRRWGMRLLMRGQVGARRRKVSLEHTATWGAEPRPRLREGQRKDVVV